MLILWAVGALLMILRLRVVGLLTWYPPNSMMGGLISMKELPAVRIREAEWRMRDFCC